MPQTIEDLIRKAIEEGRFSGLTLWPCSAGFQSNFKDKKTGGWRCEVHEDPIEAMRASLGEKPAAAADEGSVFD